MCLDHPNNAFGELKSWLAKSSLKFIVGVVKAQLENPATVTEEMQVVREAQDNTMTY